MDFAFGQHRQNGAVRIRNGCYLLSTSCPHQSGVSAVLPQDLPGKGGEKGAMGNNFCLCAVWVGQCHCWGFAMHSGKVVVRGLGLSGGHTGGRYDLGRMGRRWGRKETWEMHKQKGLPRRCGGDQYLHRYLDVGNSAVVYQGTEDECMEEDGGGGDVWHRDAVSFSFFTPMFFLIPCFGRHCHVRCSLLTWTWIVSRYSVASDCVN